LVAATLPAAPVAPEGPVPDPTTSGRGARWAGLLVLLTGAVLALVWQRFYYGNDDLLQFSVARDKGLSWTLLTLNVFQHFGPYNRFGHLLVLHAGDLSPYPGLALVGLNVAALLLASFWLMSELRLSALRRALALVLIALSVSVSETAIWFDSVMHTLPAIAVTLAICAAHIRGVRTGRASWHVLSLGLFVLGQATQERPVLALPLVVLIDLLLVWRLLPWRERFRRLWRLRWPLLAMTVLAAAIAAALRAFVVLDDLPVPDLATTGRAMLSSFSNYVLPSMANLPLPAPAPVLIQAAVLVAAVVAAVLVARLRPGNAGPLLFVGAVFLLYYGFLKFSPLLSPGSIDANAKRLTNAVYVTVPWAIALVHLRVPRGRDLVRRLPHRRAAALAVVLLTGYLVVSNVVYLDRQWADTTAARHYLDTVRADSAQWSDPGVTVVPLLAPDAMALAWSVPYGRHDHLLRLVDRYFRVGDLGPRTVVIDDTGAVRPVALAPVRGRTEVISGRCSDPRTAAARDTLLSITPPAAHGPLFVRVTYEASQDMTVQLAGRRGSRGWQLNGVRTQLDAGRHTQLLPLDAPALDAVDMHPIGGGDVCVQRIDLVRPVLLGDGGDTCRAIDRYGRPEGRVGCP
jgi:hypothetical protein